LEWLVLAVFYNTSKLAKKPSKVARVSTMAAEMAVPLGDYVSWVLTRPRLICSLSWLRKFFQFISVQWVDQMGEKGLSDSDGVLK
jgi:bacteriorhodopsin